MTTVDIIIIVLLVLFGIIGFFKGFVKQIISIGGWIVAIACCFLFTGKVATFIAEKDVFSVNTTITEKIDTWLGGKELFQTTIPEGGDVNTVMKTALTDLGLPEFLTELLLGKSESGTEDAVGKTLGEYISPWIVNACMSIIATIVIFIVTLIIFAIIGFILKKLFDNSITRPIDRILGAVFNIGKIALFVWVAMLLLSVVGGLIPPIEEFVGNNLQFESTDFHIGKWMYENNPLKYIISKAL